MKKILLACTVFCCLSAGAQTTSFGIKAGVTSSSTVIRIEEGDADATLTGNRPGFIIGGVADIKFNDNFSIQPNLLFAVKNGYFLTSGKYSAMTLDLPINFLYHHNGFFAGAGPNLSYGLSAKVKPFGDSDEELDLYEEIEGEEAAFTRFEVGVNVLLGYKFTSGLTLSAHYTPGITSLAKNDDFSDEFKINNRMLGISIGFNF